MEDDVLLQGIKEGEKKALDTLYIKYREKFIRRINKLL